MIENLWEILFLKGKGGNGVNYRVFKADAGRSHPRQHENGERGDGSFEQKRHSRDIGQWLGRGDFHRLTQITVNNMGRMSGHRDGFCRIP